MLGRLQWEITKLAFKAIVAAERLVYGVSFNLYDPRLKQDPYTPYNRLREKRPIHYSAVTRSWWITRFDLAQELLKDKRFGLDVRKFPKKAEQARKLLAGDAERLALFEGPSLLAADPPDHTRIRRVIQHDFLNRSIQRLEPFIADLALELLPQVDQRMPFDFMDRLARPLPANVIGKMMGIPQEDFESLTQWSLDMTASIWSGDWDVMQRGENAHKQIIQAFRRLREARRGAPGEDLIDVLIDAEEKAEISDLEMYNTCWQMLLAGHETTTRLLGSAVYHFLSIEGLWQQLVENRTLLPQAIEEVLRFEPPLQATFRFVLEDLDFHGAKFKKGDTVYVSLSGINRDPEANSEPNKFDVQRGKVKHLSFGAGIHTCFGSALARLEARIVLNQLLELYPNMRLTDDQPVWGDNPVFRGLETLIVDPGPAVQVKQSDLQLSMA